MKAKELIERLIWQENELYNLYKLGETFALFERPKLRDTFALMAEEELRHRETLKGLLNNKTLQDYIVDYWDELSVQSVLYDEILDPETLEELVVEAIVREKHAYKTYSELFKLLKGSFGDIFRMMAQEELAHIYRLKLIYELLD